MSLSGVPNEIASQIAEHLESDNDYVALNALSKVSRFWNETAVICLYRSINLAKGCANSIDLLRLFLTTLQRPDIPLGVCSITLSNPDYPFLKSDSSAYDALECSLPSIINLVDEKLGIDAPDCVRDWLLESIEGFGSGKNYRFTSCLALLLLQSVRLKEIKITAGDNSDGLVARTISYLANQAYERSNPSVLQNYASKNCTLGNRTLKNTPGGALRDPWSKEVDVARQPNNAAFGYPRLKTLHLYQCGSFDFPMIPSLETLEIEECDVFVLDGISNSASSGRLKSLKFSDVLISSKDLIALISSGFLRRLAHLSLIDTLTEDADHIDLVQAICTHLPDLECLEWHNYKDTPLRNADYQREGFSALTRLKRLTIGCGFLFGASAIGPASIIPPSIESLVLENVLYERLDELIRYLGEAYAVAYLCCVVSSLRAQEFVIRLSLPKKPIKEQLPLTDMRKLLRDISKALASIGVNFKVYSSSSFHPWVSPDEDSATNDDCNQECPWNNDQENRERREEYIDVEW